MFLETVSFSHGSILDVSSVARECKVERKTVEGYLSILEDLLLSFKVPVFTRKAKRRLSAHPKFYLFDTGVFTALRPRGPLDDVSEIHGPALEGLIAQHFRTWCGYREEICGLYSWRTRSGKDYPQAGALLIYRGRERLVQKGILCISYDAFLKALTPGRSIKEAAGA